MRELTNIELDAVAGGDGPPMIPVWMNTLTKYINNFPVNLQANAQNTSGWAGFGNYAPQFTLNAVNNNI